MLVVKITYIGPRIQSKCMPPVISRDTGSLRMAHTPRLPNSQNVQLIPQHTETVLSAETLEDDIHL